MSNCRFFREYTAKQKQHLIDAINEEKWYMSEREGRDVGFDAAMNRFIESHLDRFASDFRIQFCREECPLRRECELARSVHRMSSTRDILIPRAEHSLCKS